MAFRATPTPIWSEHFAPPRARKSLRTVLVTRHCSCGIDCQVYRLLNMQQLLSMGKTIRIQIYTAFFQWLTLSFVDVWLLIAYSLCPRRHLYTPPPVPPRRPCCSCVPVVIYIFCVPVVIGVPVSRSVICLWVSRSSFIFPVSRCPFPFLVLFFLLF